MMSGYGLGYIHLMDVCMNIFLLADYIDVSAIVVIGFGCSWCIIFSAILFFYIFLTVDSDFYIFM